MSANDMIDDLMCLCKWAVVIRMCPDALTKTKRDLNEESKAHDL